MINSRKVYMILMKFPSQKKFRITEQIMEVDKFYDGVDAKTCAQWKVEYYQKIFPENTIICDEGIIIGENL